MTREQRAYWLSRRNFCWTLAGLFVTPSIAIAQGSRVVRRIGALEYGMPWPPELIQKETDPLRELGWIEGQNLRVERRYDMGRSDMLQALAEELVHAQVELIVTAGTPATLAAMRATSTIPIVFRTAGDPVLLGLVASLARPGGNVTGYSNAGPEVAAKSLSVLKELLPGLQRVGALWETAHPYYRATRAQFAHTCQSLGLETIFVDYAAPAEIGGAIAQLAAQRRAQALIVQSDDFTWDNRFEIFDAAKKHRLPTMADDDKWCETGVPSSPTLLRCLNKTAYAPNTSTESFAAQNLPISLSVSPRSSTW